tara:strand:- start:96 stop:425 length:330 start_codon:yes stop_codon:yes gene_type:complete
MSFVKLETNALRPDTWWLGKFLVLNTNKIASITITATPTLLVEYILAGAQTLKLEIELSTSSSYYTPSYPSTAQMDIEKDNLVKTISLNKPGIIYRPSSGLYIRDVSLA